MADVRQQAADLLLEAYATKTPIAPLISTFEGLSIEDAYDIQLRQIKSMLAGGRVIKGMKVGLTSAAMQNLLGVRQPDFGHLLDDFFYLEHEPIPADRFLQPRIEPEVAFVLKKPLKGPGVTVMEAIAAIDFVLPALEIVDSRIADWKIGIIDTIADNASSGLFVIGQQGRPLFRRNGEIVGTGAGGAVLGSPLNSLIWLANTVGALGTTLEAGYVILPGSITAMVPVAPGDTITASFSGLGSVTARFAKKEQA